MATGITPILISRLNSPSACLALSFASLSTPTLGPKRLFVYPRFLDWSALPGHACDRSLVGSGELSWGCIMHETR
ncbi:uncharacterized protein BO97DRAFT_402186 [Aspergillus homomorphus CBS 101889]|uniref:Uncharacterized protein n=1 Tax=Aspergillus homomorphus (strain CBS 101889) TaxID=1450537 RepID=A0A395ICA8_ASPHC|nr:hypothetical protein BO97DRAFT_402186 [Aspergillus homomorphus CBS 101889]RAL17671.1 hypothetical protein BO97DRAFT_402186 [Aspergillus homomorphus CBS 101889]